MKSPFDLLPSITSTKFPFEPYPGATGVTGQVFRNTDTTYKFFWFLSLLEEARVSDFNADLRVGDQGTGARNRSPSVAMQAAIQALVWASGPAPETYRPVSRKVRDTGQRPVRRGPRCRFPAVGDGAKAFYRILFRTGFSRRGFGVPSLALVITAETG
jgi:hypothetical protein